MKIDLSKIPDGVIIFDRFNNYKVELSSSIRYAVQSDKGPNSFAQFVPDKELGKWSSLTNPDGSPNNPTQADWDELVKHESPYPLGTWGFFWDEKYMVSVLGKLTDFWPAYAYPFGLGSNGYKNFRPYNEGPPPHIAAELQPQPQPELNPGDWVVVWNNGDNVPFMGIYVHGNYATNPDSGFDPEWDNMIPYNGPTPWKK